MTGIKSGRITIAIYFVAIAAIMLYQHGLLSVGKAELTNAVLTLVTGVLTALAGVEWSEQRKSEWESRANRHRLLGEVVVTGEDYLATIIEVSQERREGQIDNRSMARVMRIDAQMQKLSFELMTWFPERDVRAAAGKLHSRLRETRDLIMIEPEGCKLELVGAAVEWVDEQMSSFKEAATKRAGVPTVLPEELMFVGFRRVTPKDRAEAMKRYSLEDSPPPWKADLGSKQDHR